MKKTYRKTRGARITEKDAETVGLELDRINATYGSITADLVLSEARKKRSKLHRFFEWDDTKAAEEHRRTQARTLIRSVQIEVTPSEDKPSIQLRGFVQVTRATDGDEEENVYKPTIEAMSDADYREQVLTRALAELNSWQKRYAEFKELASIFKAIESVQRKVKKPRRKRTRKAA